MLRPHQKDAIVRSGRDAAVAAFRRDDGSRAECPFHPTSKSAIFWRHGAEQAEAALKLLDRIGV